MTAPVPLLEVRGLRKWFEVRRGIIPRVVANVKAVDDVSFAVAPHQVLGIAGESGSGKTTIGRAILRLIEPTAGQILFNGTDITADLAGCLFGTLAADGAVLRCPGVPASLLPLGDNILDISVELDDGTTITQSATWTIMSATE